MAHRYEKTFPGELVHADIKKLGRIPDGGGHRVVVRFQGRQNTRASGHAGGYAYLHHAIDDYSRLVYSEILDDAQTDTAAGFWSRAQQFFAHAGITVHAVMTDNGSYYRPTAFRDALGPMVKHRRRRPYRPQTNGKVERFNRNLAAEWAYAQAYRSDEERARAYQAQCPHVTFSPMEHICHQERH